MPQNPSSTPGRDGTADRLVGELVGLLSAGQVFADGPQFRAALQDGTANRGLTGTAEVLVEPETSAQVAAVVRYCYERELPIVTRGGGTGLAGGAVPDGGVIISLIRMNRVRSIDPGQWRIEVEAGVTTGTVHRIAREHGLLFPPDPGASEQSTIGGNIATNAGGPHAFRYGVTGSWVTGLEAVVPPGEIVRTGGPIRKDVAGLDLQGLLIGSEGTLGIVTSAWLRLVPAPESRGVAIGFYDGTPAGCDAIEAVLAAGLQPTALEFLDRGTLEASVASFPFDAPRSPGFMVVAEADGSSAEVERVLGELKEAMAEGAVSRLAIADPSETRALWTWRDGVSYAVAAQRGGKISEDIVVPVDRLSEAIERTVEIGRRHRLEACSWGHAGDGNLHSTFRVDLDDIDEVGRATDASADLFKMATELGGSISGEHGIGSLKVDYVEAALGAGASRLQSEIKRAFDPKLLLNPGTKVPPKKV